MSLRELPAVHTLLAEPVLSAQAARFGSLAVKEAVAAALDDARAAIARGSAPLPVGALVAATVERLAEREMHGLLEVLNGTGVLLHTNLGRAPLARAALEALERVGGGYSNLEFDLESGARGSRYARVSDLLRETTGAQDGLVVNNCAAAMLLALDTFAREREVVVARGELVEIGGGFRLPEVLARSGASLVEVGTTNRVYLRDYERALGPRSALLLRSHRSNFVLSGFTAGLAPADLAGLGRRAGIPVLEDLGSGALVDLTRFGLPHEPTVQESVAAGVDLVAFSGDKLLGGPQAGIVVGKAPLIARLRSNPLLRALRVDKATLAALGATLRCYLEPQALSAIPFYAMLEVTLEQLRQRAHALTRPLAERGLDVRPVETQAYAGGGTLPLAALPSAGFAVRAPGGAEAAAAALRRAHPPLIARIERDEVLVDLRAIPAQRDGEVAAALERLIG